MTTTTSQHPTMAAAALPQTGSGALIRDILLVVAGSVLLTLSAKVNVPFWPVPMTMQTFAVLFLGAALGMRLGIATVMLYLVEGAMHLPVFAGTPEKGIGLVYMMGPTGGYLVGFVVAAAIVGWAAEKGWGRSWLGMLVAMTLATLAIFALGYTWLQTLIGAEKAFAAGVLPFLPGAGLKILLAVAAVVFGWRVLDKRARD